jgi:hypothetical protein
LDLTLKVEPFSLTHPMLFGVCFMNKTNAHIYIMCTFKIYGKRYGIKNLIASATNVIALVEISQNLTTTFAITCNL